MNLSLNKSNNIGLIASGLCLIHCILTPFIFIASVCAESCCEAAPDWWRYIDVLFLLIAFFAVYQSAKTTSKKAIGLGLWISWLMLFLVIINENIQLLSLPDYLIYFPTLSLIALHIYNRRYCKCEEDQWCAEN